MNRRYGLVVLVLALVAPGTAHAAPRQCKLVTDPAGDVENGINGGTDPRHPKSPDILSADIASNGKTITAVIRVVRLADWHTDSPGGLTAGFQFTIGRTRFDIGGGKTNVQESYTMWRMYGPAGQESYSYIAPTTGVFDEDSSEIRVNAPLASLGIKNSKGLVATDLAATTEQYVDGAIVQTASTVDTASSKATYKLGSPSCLKVPA